jgi:hypothetical protein
MSPWLGIVVVIELELTASIEYSEKKFGWNLVHGLIGLIVNRDQRRYIENVRDETLTVAMRG